MTPPDLTPRSVVAERVDWRRIGLFYGVASAWVAAVAGIAAAAGGELDGFLPSLVIGGISMFGPLVAGLLTERVAGRRSLLAGEVAAVRSGAGRVIGRVALWSAVAYFAVALVLLAGSWLLQGVPGAGQWATQAEFEEHLRGLFPVEPNNPPPPIAVLVVLAVPQALVAGLTINGLFALGEEYGWRGVLADELRPLGTMRANLLTGVLWGLWHAPLVLLGLNYGGQWAWGIPLFVAFTTPMSFVLWWVRERARSVFAPAAVHGAFNAFAGLFTLILIDANPLVAPPVGILAGALTTVVAAALFLRK